MNSSAYSVSELTLLLKKEIEPRFQNISVEGEVSNLKKQASGHLYFSLKDDHSQLQAVFFKGAQKNLDRLPKEGDKVTLSGELSIYAPRGSYQLITRKISFDGEGELLKKFLALKEKLKHLGWLEKERKKPLPAFPQKIGVITSPTGAVIQDILHVLQRRFSNFSLCIYPVQVQGEEAAGQIATAIQECNKYKLVDVLILARGGGSIEDLWAFNEEMVAEAIYQSKIPLISAIGHETDFTLADFVADVRAPTPSAAAEIVLQEKKSLLEKLSSYALQMKKQLAFQIKHAREIYNSFCKQNFFSSPYSMLSTWMQNLDEKQIRIEAYTKRQLGQFHKELGALKKRLFFSSPKNQWIFQKESFQKLQHKWESAWQFFLLRKREAFLQKKALFRPPHLEPLQKKIQQVKNHLYSINPKNLLNLGYTILFAQKDHSIILSTKEVIKEQKVYALVKDGKIFAEILNTEPL